MKEKGFKSNTGGIRVLLMQIVTVALLIACLWSMIYFGGSAAKSLKSGIKALLTNNTVAARIATAFDGPVTFEDTPPESNVVMTNAAYVMKAGLSVNYDTPVLPIEPGQGHITSLFGDRDNPTANGTEFHKGLDIGANTGTPVAAMTFGVVTDAGKDKWYGNYVVIESGSMTCKYGHCHKVLVGIGDIVNAGDTVALVGNTGNSTGSHLHVEMRKDGELVDPADYIAVSRYG